MAEPDDPIYPMTDERKLVQLDGAYIAALGLAVFTFARCEWQAVWCCERIKPGALDKIVSKRMTAGQIAKHFADLVRNMPKSRKRGYLLGASKEFTAIVDMRDRIVHGKPCTALDGAQRLNDANGIIETHDLEAAADAFTSCANRLNELFYGFLAR